jgi:hypothetical protein
LVYELIGLYDSRFWRSIIKTIQEPEAAMKMTKTAIDFVIGCSVVSGMVKVAPEEANMMPVSASEALNALPAHIGLFAHNPAHP